MPANVYSLFYEANINRAVVDLVLRSIPKIPAVIIFTGLNVGRTSGSHLFWNGG